MPPGIEQLLPKMLDLSVAALNLSPARAKNKTKGCGVRDTPLMTRQLLGSASGWDKPKASSIKAEPQDLEILALCEGGLGRPAITSNSRGLAPRCLRLPLRSMDGLPICCVCCSELGTNGGERPSCALVSAPTNPPCVSMLPRVWRRAGRACLRPQRLHGLPRRHTASLLLEYALPAVPPTLRRRLSAGGQP